MLSISSLSNTLLPPTLTTFSYPSSSLKQNSINYPFQLSKNPSFPHQNLQIPFRKSILKCSDSDSEVSTSEEKDEWLSKLPDKKKPLYAHSLPCIEAWLKSLGFQQSRDDMALWFVQKPAWHAHLSLDVTDLYVRYLKNGPGNLEKDVERRFSYALSREDIENAVLGGP